MPRMIERLRPDPSTASRELRRVSFAGRLRTITRRAATDAVREHGGAVATNLSRRTSMLVVGAGGWPVRQDGSISRTLRRAEDLNARGACIRIVPEEEFLEVTGLQAPPPPTGKSFDVPSVAQMFGVEPTLLRRWEALGLVRSTCGAYDFRDLVALRAIAELSAQGVPPATIARTVRGLGAVLPDVERPLAQLRLVERDGALLAEIGDALLDEGGQYVLDFDGAGAPRESREGDAIAPRFDAEDTDAHAWLERGVALEEEGDLVEAAAAYRRALRLEPHWPEAHFNLGNALRGQGRADAAAAHFQLAVDQDPSLAAAWYNLADVHEEAGDLDAAIECLEAALRACPEHADAHYNLALCCEEAGRDGEARAHWQAYLRLDPESTWAAVAREHLRSLGA